jgi:hypothetical protein
MRLAALVLVGACGGASAPAPATATATATITVGAPTTSLEVGHLGPPPDDVEDHLHAPPVYVADLDRLYVEITSEGEHADVLRASATTGLGTVPHTVSVDDGGDLELHVELVSLTTARDGAACKLKIYVMRLPQHDLLAIADGSGRATGTSPDDACLSTMGSAIVRQKLPPLLARQLEAKR